MQTRCSWWALVAGALLVTYSARSWAESDAQPDFYSLKDWAPVYTWEYFAIPAGNAARLTITLIVHPPTRWRGGILFDDWVKRGLSLNCEAARTHAGTASTILTVTLGLVPPLLDAGLLTGWIHHRTDLAWQAHSSGASIAAIYSGPALRFSRPVLGRRLLGTPVELVDFVQLSRVPVTPGAQLGNQRLQLTPSLVAEYSTRGGTCLKISRRTMPCSSISRSCWISTF